MEIRERKGMEEGRKEGMREEDKKQADEKGKGRKERQNISLKF